MPELRNILVADKNPHVRRLICRELKGAKQYVPRPVCSGREVLLWACRSPWADLVVIDPDFPDCQPDDLLNQMAASRPDMAVVIHALIETLPEGIPKYPVVEKAGDSIPCLVQRIMALSGASEREVVGAEAPANASAESSGDGTVIPSG
jgi:CheY-like chemotaxis protein